MLTSLSYKNQSKKTNMKKTDFLIISLILAGFIFIFGSLATEARAQAVLDSGFNPNNIISDAEMLDVYSLSLTEIQNFLQEKGSYLASYQTLSAYGELKTAAEIIYDAARNNYDCKDVILSDSPTEAERKLKCRTITTINPKVLLVLLQKEQSLIQNPSPTQKALDEATGYGCPTGQTCNPYWKGFGKQVNSAALQFAAYMKNPNSYGFRNSITYIAKDARSMLKSVTRAVQDGDYNSIVSNPGFMTITIENQATAALYNYTPHVYNGNFNFYRLYNSYFPKSNNNITALKLIYPDGSILKLEGDPGIWLIEQGKRRPFLNYSSFISRFNPRQVITTNKTILDTYPVGENIKFPNYSLVQTPDKKIYLLAGNEKRPFDSLTTFRAIGFNTEELEQATETELAGYAIGKEINASSTYVTGALLQNIKTGGVYYVENGTKAPLLDRAFLTQKYKDKKIMPATTAVLDKYLTIEPMLFDNGTLLKSESFPTVYLISNGTKRAFASEEIFKSLGYNMDNIIIVSSRILYLYPSGEIIQ